MRKLFKRAFTLVELLVVIAILGVLATVSIVGYSSYTKRANLQADSTLVSEWNHLLLAEDNINEIDNVNEAKELFISHSTNEDTFVPKSNNYHFYYNTTYNNVFLVDDSNGFTVSYPTDNTITAANSYRLDKAYVLIDCDITDTTIDKNAIEKGVDNTITFSGTVPASVKIGTEFYKVENDKITVNSNTNVEIVKDTTVYVSGVKIDHTGFESGLTYSESKSLSAIISPDGANSEQTITWTSSTPAVADINSEGEVTAYNVGNTTITVKVEDFLGEYTDTYVVNVVAKNVTITANAQVINYGSNIVVDTTEVTANSLVSDHAITAITLTPSDVNVTTTGTITPSAATIKYGETDVTSNYNINYVPGNLTINKVDATIGTVPTAKVLSYSAQDQALVDAGRGITGGTLQYTLGTDATNAPTTGYSESIPTGINAGTYYVWYKVVGDSNHNDTTANVIEVTINTVVASIVNEPSAKTGLTFNNSDIELVNAGSGITGGTLQYTLGTDATNAPTTGYSESIPTGKNAGTYYVWYKVVGDSNHNDTTAKYLEITIAKATANVTI